VVARLAAAGRTAPGGEEHEVFLARAADAARRLRSELAVAGDPLLVVSHGGLLNYALQYLMEVPVRDEVPFGFDYCGVVCVVSHREAPDYGPFPMLRFASM
jgi:broad specificity phosphatase PhoE